jgi:hypothetical protein
MVYQIALGQPLLGKPRWVVIAFQAGIHAERSASIRVEADGRLTFEVPARA